MTEIPRDPIPEDEFDKVVADFYDDHTVTDDSDQFSDRIIELDIRVRAIISRLHERNPEIVLNWDNYVANLEADKLEGTTEDIIIDQIVRLAQDMPSETDTWATDAQRSAMKLELATEYLTAFESDIQKVLLQAIDMSTQSSLQVSELSSDEIRFMNLATNGTSPERQAVYDQTHRVIKQDLKQRLEEIIRRKYGDHSSIERDARRLLHVASQYGTAKWEYLRTTDSTEIVKLKNYHEKVLVLNILMHRMRENSFMDDDTIDSLVKWVEANTMRYLDTLDDVHKR